VHAGVFHVDVAAEASVEEQVPTGVMVVIVNVDLILIPSPIAAAIDVVGGHNPRGIVVEHDAPGPDIEPVNDVNISHMLITPVRISAAGANAVVVGIPITVLIANLLLFPTFVLAVVVPVAAVVIPMLIPAFVFSVVLVVITIPAVVAVL